MVSNALSLKTATTSKPAVCKTPPPPPPLIPPILTSAIFLAQCMIQKIGAPYNPDFSEEATLKRTLPDDFWYGESLGPLEGDRIYVWLWESHIIPKYNLKVTWMWPLVAWTQKTWPHQDWRGDRPYVGKQLYGLNTLVPADMFAIVNEIPS